MSDTEVTAIERHAAALARDLAYWKNLLTTRTNTLQARAEKAEAERDEFRSQAALFQTGLAKAEQALVEADSILSLIRHRYLFPGKHPADLFDDVDSTLRHIRQVVER